LHDKEQLLARSRLIGSLFEHANEPLCRDVGAAEVGERTHHELELEIVDRQRGRDLLARKTRDDLVDQVRRLRR
jgi:hypothetical protein